MKRIVIIILALTMLGYLVFCALLFFYQRSFLYFPTTEATMPGSTSFSLKNEGETIRVWTRAVESSDAVIYFGGNAEDVSTNFRAPASVRELKPITIALEASARFTSDSVMAPTPA